MVKKECKFGKVKSTGLCRKTRKRDRSTDIYNNCMKEAEQDCRGKAADIKLESW